jgi:hypothetical protein
MVNVARPGPRGRDADLPPVDGSVRGAMDALSGEELVDTYDATIAYVRGLLPELTRTVDALDRHARNRAPLTGERGD